MPDHARRGPGLVAACVALAGLSLLLPWALAFDPWAWVTWGRDLTRFELNTAGGPSWKPLPVVATTPLAFTGAAAPALWLVLARAGGLLAVAGAALLAYRLVAARQAGASTAGPDARRRGAPVPDAGVPPAGATPRFGGASAPAAAVAAGGAMALSSWWLFNTALGNSEGLLVAAALWAAAAHLAGRWRAALALGVAAALLRPEAWPFLGLYAFWLWRSRRASPGGLALALAPVPLLWFGPDVLGAGGALGASDAARGTASPQSAVYADFPALEVLVDFAELVTAPVLLAALAGAALGDRRARALAAAALAWVALVALMTQAGYAGNPRYNVVPAAVACVLAGIGVAALAARLAPRGAGRPAAVAAALGAVLLVATFAFTRGDLADQVDELDARAERRADLNTLADRAGDVCGPLRTNQPMKAMVGWRFDVPMEHLADPPGPRGTVVAAPPGYEGGPPLPASEMPQRARAGDWTLRARCGGRAMP